MELGQVDSGNSVRFDGADVTKHLRDHLDCALRLARSHDFLVVHYLVEMALLALSAPPPATAEHAQNGHAYAPAATSPGTGRFG